MTYVGMKHRHSTKLAISRGLAGNSNAKGHKGSNGGITRAVIQKSLDGAIIAEFASLSKAAAAVSGNVVGICRTCRGQASQAHGFLWSYKNPKKARGKAVTQYTTKMEFVAEHASVTEAGDAVGVTKGAISQACRNYRSSRTAGGFIWRYAEK